MSELKLCIPRLIIDGTNKTDKKPNKTDAKTNIDDNKKSDNIIDAKTNEIQIGGKTYPSIEIAIFSWCYYNIPREFINHLKLGIYKNFQCIHTRTINFMDYSSQDKYYLYIMNNKYFNDIKFNTNGYNEEPIMVNTRGSGRVAIGIMICLIEDNLNILIKDNRLLPDFIKLFFDNIENILILNEQFNFTEVWQFIETILILREPPTHKKISLREFIINNGGEDYIEKMLSNFSKYMEIYEENYYTPLSPKEIIHKTKQLMITKNNKTDFISFALSSIDYSDVEFLGNSIYFPGPSFFNIIRKLQHIEQSAINTKPIELFNIMCNKPIYSAFLHAYTNEYHHYYKSHCQEFVNNDFYAKMKKASLLLNKYNKKLGSMLTANLSILLQNG